MAALLGYLWSLEGLAFVLALAYLVLVARENIWCWYCAFSSSALYVVIYWQASLLNESVLSVFYLAMAVLGWFEWRRGGPGKSDLKITSLNWKQHIVLFALVSLLTLANGWALQRWTSAAFPYVDSFIAWGSVVTTMLVVRKVLENWLYWILFDGIAIYVYIDRGLYMTAALFALYIVIVIFGYFEWRREFRTYSVASG